MYDWRTKGENNQQPFGTIKDNRLCGKKDEEVKNGRIFFFFFFERTKRSLVDVLIVSASRARIAPWREKKRLLMFDFAPGLQSGASVLRFAVFEDVSKTIPLYQLERNSKPMSNSQSPLKL